MFTSEKPSLPVAIIAIAEVRRGAENADLLGVLKPSQDAIVRDVAEEEITPISEPHRPFGPPGAGVKALDCSVEYPVFGEARLDYFKGWIGIEDRGSAFLLLHESQRIK